IEPVEECGTRAAYVQIAGRRGSKTGDDGVRHRQGSGLGWRVDHARRGFTRSCRAWGRGGARGRTAAAMRPAPRPGEVGRRQEQNPRRVEASMAIPATMNALLLKAEGYSREPSVGALQTLQPWLEQATVAVPQPEPTQVLIKVRMASINPSDVLFVQGLY